MHQISPKPVDWVDQATGGEPTLFLGQQLGKDTNPIWLLEFWNYAINKIWSLDGTAPLPSLSPDLGKPDGTMSPDPGVRWVVTGNGVEVVGEKVGEPRSGMQLWRVQPPARFRNTQTGVFPDGWMSSSADVLAVRAGRRRLARLLEGRRLPAGRLRPTPDGRRHRADRPRRRHRQAAGFRRGSTRSSGASSSPAA